MDEKKDLKEQEKFYSTRQLGEASALVSAGFPVVSIDMEYDQGQVIGYFYFENSDDLQGLVQDFLNRKMLVEPNEFLSNLRSLKSRVSNRERQKSLKK